MKITYYGHSAFLVEDLLIDPYLSDSPLTDIQPEDIKCKIVCITHHHPDHIGDAFKIAEANDACIVAIHEISVEAGDKKLKTEGMNIGGSIDLGDWNIKMVLASHSSESGHPAAFVLKNKKHKQTIYHAGDTGLFGDMKLIGEIGIDIAMLPIGGRYTMDIDDALQAAEMIKPKAVIPMHYDTFPIIKANPEDFKKKYPRTTEIFKFNETKDL